MCGHVFCLATLMLGIDVTFEPLPDGDGTLYWIQIEPEQIDSLRSGGSVQSYIPSRAWPVRALRITMGREKLPAEVLPPATAEKPPVGPLVPRPAAPGVFDPEPAGKPIHPVAAMPGAVEQTSYVKPVDEPPAPETQLPPEPTPETESQSEEPAKPWGWLVLTLLGLFTSLGANGFLLWTATDFRRRYRTLVQRESVGSDLE